MPKTTVSIQVGDKKKFKKIRTKFRVGPRGSESAHSSSNEQLIAMSTNPKQDRYSVKAKQVLRLRGITF